ncbi:MAG: hypothetical protein ABR526_05880 [Chthoniobacterales bacterium]
MHAATPGRATQLLIVNLYRIMADVRAGVGQPTVASGDAGIATLWVRAESEPLALEHGAVVLARRGYSEVGPLRSYLEELDDDPFAATTAEERAADQREHAVLAGYDAIKQQALTQGDGLHEVWLGGLDGNSSGPGARAHQ